MEYYHKQNMQEAVNGIIKVLVNIPAQYTDAQAAKHIGVPMVTVRLMKNAATAMQAELARLN